eukprot:EC723739.1.p1 GENE.EC723739.1~~EC723739.1.p1  ORF type:complete len:187 (+),score=25.93 EC723739.1:69-629(+)
MSALSASTRLRFLSTVRTALVTVRAAHNSSQNQVDAKYLQYDNPLTGRYSSPEMSKVWSPQFKFTTWRRLWLALAESQKDLGLPISQEQVDEIRANLENINFSIAEAKEREVRHDVMSHVHALGVQAPKAMPILHLGATSAFVGDNAELIQLRESLHLVQRNLYRSLKPLQPTAGSLPCTRSCVPW